MTATLERIYTEWTAAHPHAAEDFHSTIEDLLVDAGVAFDRVTVRVNLHSQRKNTVFRFSIPSMEANRSCTPNRLISAEAGWLRRSTRATNVQPV